MFVFNLYFVLYFTKREIIDRNGEDGKTSLRVPLTSSVFVLKTSRRSLCVPEENIVQKKILLTRKSEFFGPFHSILL